MELRFHLDENVPHAIANGLQRRGINVTTTKEAGLLGASDEEHLAYAHADNRVIFSCDDDFLSLASRGIVHSGIAFCHPKARTIGQIVNGLVALWRAKTAEEMRGQIHFL
jgi:hypothetical protein